MLRNLSRGFCASSQNADAVVVGAGVVGLSIARSMALSGLKVMILEREKAYGTKTSSRNSEIIHAGMHYTPGSVKAKACVEGKQMLYDYCREKQVDFNMLGKLIVASGKEEEEKLKRTRDAAIQNGVLDLEIIGRDEARSLEPELECTAALVSPSTGLVDSQGLMRTIFGEAENCGAVLALNTEFLSASTSGTRISIRAEDASTGEQHTVDTRYLVNSAGVAAHKVAHRIEGLSSSSIPPLYLAKGSYFTMEGKSPFSRFVYPTPVDGGLGVHLTMDLHGQVKFGPDVEWVSKEDYDVDPARAPLFYESIRKYYPGLPEGSLQPAFASVRPKVAGPGQGKGDFIIQGPKEHGVRGLVNLFGIESPGLTSCLYLGEYVKNAVLS